MECMSAQRWTFDQVDATRRARLEDRFDFNELVRKLNTCDILAVELESLDRNQSLPSYFRLAYCMQVGEEFFDKFFNSEWGYRGQYFHSAVQGLAGNKQVLQELLPRLLSRMSDARAKSFELTATHRQWLSKHSETSLRANSAKLWLCERASGTIISEEFGEWGATSPDTQQKEGRLGRIQNGLWGTSELRQDNGGLAPTLSKLAIKGAFIDYAGHEWVHESKVLRADKLHRTGWA
jgi:hypothetical protein